VSQTGDDGVDDRPLTGPARDCLMPSAAGAWLRTYQPRPEAGVRLVCLPPAGASAPFFRDWVRYLPADVELTSVQYPGRLDRINDRAVSQMDTMADAVTDVLLPRAEQPFALFGHSMGAAVAFEIARRLSGNPYTRLLRLFVSGYPEPSRRRPSSFHLSSNGDLIAELSRLGVIEEALFEDLDLVQTLLPPLRSDYRIVETYHPTFDSPLATPITAIVGADDDDAPEDSVRAWRELTSAEFRFEHFPGGHFYLNERRREVVELVTSQLLADSTATGIPGPSSTHTTPR
jgi:pyochelin biosynthesis protein PchC